MNPTKQEAQLRALNGALDRLAFYVADNATRTSDVRQIRMLLAALNPTIAPGGDDTSTGDDARHARENPPCLPEPTLLYQHDGDGTKVYGYTAAQMIAALPAAGNAGAVDAESTRATFERWVAKRWGNSSERWADSGEYQYVGTRNWWECWKEALTAALAPAAQRDGAGSGGVELALQCADDLADEMESLGCGPCIGSHSPFEDALGRYRAARSGDGRGNHGHKCGVNNAIVGECTCGHAPPADPPAAGGDVEEVKILLAPVEYEAVKKMVETFTASAESLRQQLAAAEESATHWRECAQIFKDRHERDITERDRAVNALESIRQYGVDTNNADLLDAIDAAIAAGEDSTQKDPK